MFVGCVVLVARFLKLEYVVSDLVVIHLLHPVASSSSGPIVDHGTLVDDLLHTGMAVLYLRSKFPNALGSLYFAVSKWEAHRPLILSSCPLNISDDRFISI